MRIKKYINRSVSKKFSSICFNTFALFFVFVSSFEGSNRTELFVFTVFGNQTSNSYRRILKILYISDFMVFRIILTNRHLIQNINVKANTVGKVKCRQIKAAKIQEDSKCRANGEGVTQEDGELNLSTKSVAKVLEDSKPFP